MRGGYAPLRLAACRPARCRPSDLGGGDRDSRQHRPRSAGDPRNGARLDCGVGKTGGGASRQRARPRKARARHRPQRIRGTGPGVGRLLGKAAGRYPTAEPADAAAGGRLQPLCDRGGASLPGPPLDVDLRAGRYGRLSSPVRARLRGEARRAAPDGDRKERTPSGGARDRKIPLLSARAQEHRIQPRDAPHAHP